MTSLVGLVERAATLAERLGPDFELPEATELACARFERWKNAIGGGKPELFGRRLAWAGLDEDRARAACGDVRFRGGNLPEWARALGGLLDRNWREGEFRFFHPQGSWPFQQVLAPLVEHASSEMPWPSSGEGVPIAFERQLLGQLSETATPILLHEFEVHRAVGRALRRGFATDLFGDFARDLLSGGWQRLWEKYPVLARRMGTRMAFWRTNTIEFLTRLAEDRPVLEQRFAPSGLGELKEARPGLSDPHAGGRNAIWAEFECGFQAVYKPRNIDAEPAFSALIDWMNDRGLSPSLKSYETLALADHGWSVVVRHLECDSEEQVRRYYERIGVLTAVLYALGTTDCHQENIIAHGEFPVLIDAETLLTPALAPAAKLDRDTGSGLAQLVQQHSVLKSLLVPPGSHLPGRQFAHLAGVMRADANEMIQAMTWANANSDWMRLREQQIQMPAERNQVLCNGKGAGAERYVDCIVAGFERGYRFLLAHRDQLLSGPLAAWRTLPLRAVIRATRTYAALLSAASTPAASADGYETSLVFDALTRPFLGAEQAPPAFAAIAAEITAMSQGDVPLFSTSGDSTNLASPEGSCAEGFFARPGYRVMRESMEAMSLEDLAVQRGLIRAGFAAVPYKPMPEVLSNDELRAEAVAIARQVRDNAFRGKDGHAFWLTVHPVEDDGWVLGPMSHNLYGGTSGTALFLASVYRVTGDAAWKELSVAALGTTSGLATQGALGGGSGTPSTAYAMSRCADLLNEPALLQEACRIARLVTDAEIAKDEVLDVIGGAAGTILALLAVHRASGDAEILRLAERCGARLLAARSDNGAWITYEGRALCGLTHGAAGIALALDRLAVATGNTEYRDAALRAIEYENSLFNESQSNWPDLRRDGVYSPTWCHGAPGIGLARLEFKGRLGCASADVDAALLCARNAVSSGVDHLCCGDLGRTELLLEAGGNQEEAAATASRTVKAARARGHYRLNWSEQYFWSSFHQGMAGIGYQLLRVAQPELLPSVLRWA